MGRVFKINSGDYLNFNNQSYDTIFHHNYLLLGYETKIYQAKCMWI